MLESGLREQLLTITDVVNVIGQRIYPVIAPEDLTLYPCITMATASYVPAYTATPGSTGIAQKRIVLMVYSADYSDCRSVVEAIRSTMSGFQGVLPDGTQVPLCQIANSQDFYESDSRLYRSALHLLMQYQE
jgi:hypothetical protein